MNKTLYERQNPGRALRALMSVGAALCVLGLASLVFVHAPDAAISSGKGVTVTPVSARDAAAVTSNTRFATTSAENFTGVPSAESVFRGKTDIPAEEPIAQF